ncbi:YncE family protein [Olivibacter sitiensis]|uniref:YncE family protein n=1 Tax=Olivibacter sitiensis TaxID=376470 RepID=UPI0006855D31|nr:YncE family protein [Olivibacter sitiensis]
MTNKFSKLRTGKVAGTALVAIVLSAAGTAVNAQTLSKSQKVGNGLYEVAISESDGTLYVTSAGSRNDPAGFIYKLDPKTLAVKDSISLQETPPFGIAINNKTQTIYTSNTRTNSVSAIDAKTGEVLATINNGKEKSHTREIAIDEKNNLVYVSDVGDPSNIWVIDGKTNTYQYSIENTGKTTAGIIVSPDGNFLYAANMGTNEIGIIDLKAKALTKSYPSGGESPVNIALDPKGSRLFVSNQKSGDITVLNTKDGSLIKAIKTGEGAIGVAYDPLKNRIYSANRQTGTTTVIDGASYAVIADITTGSLPNYVSVNSKTGAAYVVNKAKGGRPVEGQPAPPADPDGDTVSLLLP